MNEKIELKEELLDGWLRMSMTIWNERLVKTMTYNEAVVCNLLYKQYKRKGEPLTATYLCEQLQIRKPQMNVILNRMEQEGRIERRRSVNDKRNVEIFLTPGGMQSYEQVHEEILRLPEALIAHLGEEKSRIFADMMHEVAGCFGEIVSEQTK